MSRSIKEVCIRELMIMLSLCPLPLRRVRNSITREKLRLFIRFATYKQENSDKYPLLVKVRVVLVVVFCPVEPYFVPVPSRIDLLPSMSLVTVPLSLDP